MKAIICDRCGKSEPVKQGGLGYYSPYILDVAFPPTMQQFELCEDCAEKFWKWLKEEDNKT